MFSRPIVIDSTPPIPGVTIEVTDLILINTTINATSTTGISAICIIVIICYTFTIHHLFIRQCITEIEDYDAICQRSLTQVTIAWQEFADDESPIIRLAHIRFPQLQNCSHIFQ